MVETYKGAVLSGAALLELAAAPMAEQRGVLLMPGTKAASRWNGALSSRLHRAPLEAFLGAHKRLCDLNTPRALTENLVRACLIIIEPVVPHRGSAWSALVNRDYFNGLGEAVTQVSRSLGELIHQSQLCRVVSLLSVSRLLAPNLGIDMAAAAAAAAVAASSSDQRAAVFGDNLGVLAASAVMSRSKANLDAARDVVRRGLTGILEDGASSHLSAPQFTTISGAPPSNH